MERAVVIGERASSTCGLGEGSPDMPGGRYDHHLSISLLRVRPAVRARNLRRSISSTVSFSIFFSPKDFVSLFLSTILLTDRRNLSGGFARGKKGSISILSSSS